MPMQVYELTQHLDSLDQAFQLYGLFREDTLELPKAFTEIELVMRYSLG